ncbi:TonB-dependent receptor [Lentisphaera profundi]|uniref:TonB-dependent receptor n=1 Tax=Lentisphaera profundi TaxID=1658616 RepID=A0ABY7W0R9_9BACT|nr:TonB-dependent receptor [Lentisphaera profundi]WDE99068.1 TonB-dependent receptor [Lentisphaera profundi]
MKNIFYAGVMIFLSGSLYATVALSTGTNQAALAGGGVAAPQDSTWVKLNPAAIVGMGNRVDLSLEYLRPQNEVKMGGGGLPNAIESEIDDTGNLFFPHFSMVEQLDSKSAYGIALFVNSGYSSDYSDSRSTPGQFGNYDRKLEYNSYKLSLVYAHEFNNGWRVGFGPNLSYARVRTDMLATDAPLRQTSGDNEWDDSFGAGFQLAVHRQWDRFAFGMSYTSRVWHSEFEKYDDITSHPLDMPNILQTGIAFKIKEDLTWTFDWQYLNWSSVSASGDNVTDGGFGWSNHNIFKTGLIWEANEQWTLRGGYSWGEAPIDSEAAFSNVFAPIIIEHYASCGFSYRLDEEWEIGAAYIHGFENTVTDNGRQIPAAEGTEVTSSVDIVSVGLTYYF